MITKAEAPSASVRPQPFLPIVVTQLKLSHQLLMPECFWEARVRQAGVYEEGLSRMFSRLEGHPKIRIWERQFEVAN